MPELAYAARSKISTDGGEFGLNLDSSPGNNTLSGWIEVTAAIPFDCDEIIFHLGRNGDSGTSRDLLVDLALGAAGSEQVLLPKVLLTCYGSNIGTSVRLPLALPAGQRLSARYQTSSSTNGVSLNVHYIASSPQTRGGVSRAVNYGANTGDSGGVQVDPGGSANTKSTYSEITSATSEDCRGILVCVGQQANSSPATCDTAIDIAVGAGGSEQVIVLDFRWQRHSGTNSSGNAPSMAFFPIALPAGTRIAARAACNNTDASDRLLDVVVIGVN